MKTKTGLIKQQSPLMEQYEPVQAVQLKHGQIGTKGSFVAGCRSFSYHNLVPVRPV
jgi:hypothetical protein